MCAEKIDDLTIWYTSLLDIERPLWSLIALRDCFSCCSIKRICTSISNLFASRFTIFYHFAMLGWIHFKMYPFTFAQMLFSSNLSPLNSLYLFRTQRADWLSWSSMNFPRLNPCLRVRLLSALLTFFFSWIFTGKSGIFGYAWQYWLRTRDNWLSLLLLVVYIGGTNNRVFSAAAFNHVQNWKELWWAHTSGYAKAAKKLWATDGRSI